MGESQQRQSDHPTLPARTERQIALTRAIIAFEHFWNALWPAIVPLGLLVIFSLFGLWDVLPGWAHWGLLILLPVVGGCLFWRDISHRPWPTRQDAIARIDRYSQISGRPLTAYTDELAIGSSDGELSTDTLSIWNTYKNRLRSKLSQLTIKAPVSQLPAKDPHAIRVLLALIVVIGLFASGPNVLDRLATLFDPAQSQLGSSSLAQTAWIAPPDYTRLAPVYLTGDVGNGSEVAVPAGSTFFMRVQNLRSVPEIEASALEPSPNIESAHRAPFETVEEQAFEYSTDLEESARLRVFSGRKAISDWLVRVSPDRPPVIGFTEDPHATKSNSFSVPYAIWDDYGVVTARLVVESNPVSLPELSGEEPAPETETPAASDEEETRSEYAFDIAHIWRNEPLVIDLPLNQLITQRTESKHVEDLVSHPWAGSEVRVRLEATDQLDQSGKSETLSITLPERTFRDPLARAIIEQRRTLAFNPERTDRTVQFLEALTRFPERYIKDSTVYLSLRTATRRLKSVQSLADLKEISHLLWDTAMHIEDGDRAEIAKRISRLKRQLDDALAENKPQDEIDKIMRALQNAINEYLKSLAQSGEPQPLDPNAPTISSNEINDIMKAIEEMLRTGNMEGAERLLSELMDMLENLEMVSPGSRPNMGPGEKAMEDALGDLGNIIGKQRNLLDETFRQQQDGDQGSNESGIAGDQEALRERLDDLMDNLDENGVDLPSELERAERAMRGSQESLENQDPSGAVTQQEEAIDQLREGAQALAEQLMDQMEQQLGQSGRSEQGRQAQDYDPLGRPKQRSGPEYGDNVKIPEERDLQRARRILEELRRRSAERHRPEQELDYLERLLPRF